MKKFYALLLLAYPLSEGFCACPQLTITFKHDTPRHGKVNKMNVTSDDGFFHSFSESSSQSASMQQLTISGQEDENGCQYGEKTLAINIPVPYGRGQCDTMSVQQEGEDYTLQGVSSGYGCTYENDNISVTTQE